MMRPAFFSELDNFFDNLVPAPWNNMKDIAPWNDMKDFNPSRPTNARIMKTDIIDKDDSYELVIDLPGFKKEDVTAELKDGYLVISACNKIEAETASTEDEDDSTVVNSTPKYIRRERFVGTCQRSFYVGDDMTQDNIKAAFENGVLTLDIPKNVEKLPTEKKLISIN